MRRFAAALLVILAAQAAEAEGWQRLSGDEIAEALTGRVVTYARGWQDFRASGRTLYDTGRQSWGYWAVRGARYCSLWPPSDLWACYDMSRAGDGLRWIDDTGAVTEGRLTGHVGSRDE